MAVRLDLPAIEAALAGAARDPAARPAGTEPADPDAARRMALGYAAVDALLAAGADPLALGHSAELLELNHLVLCGRDPTRRRQFAAHLAETARRFYDDPEAGADSFYAWLALQSAEPPDRFAARLWVRIVSRPQLFIEGNQRTATLLASHVLARHGLPPMVATRDAACRFAALGQRCRAIDRGAWRVALDNALGWRAVRATIRETADMSFLLGGGEMERWLGRGSLYGSRCRSMSIRR